jgi:hypothetical protein
MGKSRECPGWTVSCDSKDGKEQCWSLIEDEAIFLAAFLRPLQHYELSCWSLIEDEAI